MPAASLAASAGVAAADGLAAPQSAALPSSTDLPGAASARSGSFRVARVARLLCAWRRRDRASGVADRWEEERAARLVLQGVLDAEEAEDALAVIIAGRERMEPAQMAHALGMARTALASAMAEQRRLREPLERRLRDAAREMMRGRRPASEILNRMIELNTEAGRLFVWPELRRLVEWEAARFLRARGEVA